MMMMMMMMMMEEREYDDTNEEKKGRGGRTHMRLTLDMVHVYTVHCPHSVC